MWCCVVAVLENNETKTRFLLRTVKTKADRSHNNRVRCWMLDIQAGGRHIQELLPPSLEKEVICQYSMAPSFVKCLWGAGVMVFQCREEKHCLLRALKNRSCSALWSTPHCYIKRSLRYNKSHFLSPTLTLTQWVCTQTQSTCIFDNHS